MTQIRFQPATIPVKEPKCLSVEQITNAAWAFANSTFFKDCQLSADAVIFLKEGLKETMLQSKLKESTLLLYCKVCMIGSRHIKKVASVYNRKGLQGISDSEGLRRILRLLEPNQNIKQRSIYLKSIDIVAQSYLRFVLHPTPKMFAVCRDRVLAIGNEGMNQFFYNAVTFFRFL